VIFANIIVLVQGDPEDKEVISKKIQDVRRFYIHWGVKESKKEEEYEDMKAKHDKPPWISINLSLLAALL